MTTGLKLRFLWIASLGCSLSVLADDLRVSTRDKTINIREYHCTNVLVNVSLKTRTPPICEQLRAKEGHT